MENEEKFNYIYSAPTEEERKEIIAIRNKYIPSDNTETKLDKLRKLNDKVIKLPKIIAIILGIVGVLIFGLGMSMVLEWDIVVWGVVISAIGVIIACVSYPIYNAILKCNKKKFSNEIIMLSDEILNNDKT